MRCIPIPPTHPVGDCTGLLHRHATRCRSEPEPALGKELALGTGPLVMDGSILNLRITLRCVTSGEFLGPSHLSASLSYPACPIRILHPPPRVPSRHHITASYCILPHHHHRTYIAVQLVPPYARAHSHPSHLTSRRHPRLRRHTPSLPLPQRGLQHTYYWTEGSVSSSLHMPISTTLETSPTSPRLPKQ